MDQWHRFQCEYTATKQYRNHTSKMIVTDWIDTGASYIHVNSVGHYWQSMGYTISNQSWREVEITGEELKAKITFLN